MSFTTITGRTITAATLAAGLALALAGCGKGQEAGTGEGSAPGAAVSGGDASPAAGAGAGARSALASAPAAFGQCASCHSVEPGKHGLGPSLAGIYGTRAGEIPGYDFSPALKGSGLTWDDATLDKWLAGPMQMVPGTRMTYAGLPDAAKRQQLIAWLKTLK